MRIRLEHLVLHRNYEVQGTKNPAELTIDHSEAGRGGRYMLWVNPDRYRSMFTIIRISTTEENEEDIVLAIDPMSVKEVRFPKYEELSSELMNLLEKSSFDPFKKLRGKQLYDAPHFDPLKKTGLFNLYAKLSATVFQNGRTAFSYIDTLTGLRGDRIFARVQEELRDEVIKACMDEQFHEIGSTLHAASSAFELIDSFKTPELYGNLQLTFSCKPGTLELFVEAYIDDAGGIQSIFQVAEHKLAQSATHPYDIHQILLHYQKINPGYTLIV
ncbi:hypothetical protein L0222_17400 [bacterium]|nr:hypothetical protein [bacterium]MCI0603974.1 hypothetical protein [bacterium]